MRTRGNSRLVTFTAIVIAALVLRAFTFNSAGLDWDESLYVVIAQRWLHGGVPYVAVWDQHPMGLPALFAAAQLLVGNGLVAARLVGSLAVVGTTMLLYVILAEQIGERLAGWLAAALYLLYMTRPDGLAANTEVINNFFVTCAAALLVGAMLRPAQELPTAKLFAAALLLGAGLQIKYVVFPEAALLCSLVLLRTWWDGVPLSRVIGLAFLAMFGGILPTAMATLYFWYAGALQSYLDANVLSNTAYLSMPLDWHTALMRLRFGLLPIVALLPWPLVLTLQLPGEQRHGWRVIILVISVWLLAAAIDVTLPLKFWKHYFNALLPPLSLAAGLGMVQISRRLQQRRVWATTAMAGVVAMPAFLLMIKHMHDSRSIDRTNVPQAVAQRIRDSGDRDVYVFDYDPLVYSYADAKPPTRFVLGIELANFDASSGARPLREVDKVLARRPDWIVVAEPSPYKFSPAVLQQLDDALRDYRVDAEWHEADYIQPPIQVRLYQRVATGAEQQPNEHPDHG